MFSNEFSNLKYLKILQIASIFFKEIQIILLYNMKMGQHNRQIYRDHKSNFKIFANIFMIILIYLSYINQP